MTKVVVITCGRNGTASNCLPALVEHPSVKVCAVFLAEGSGTNKWRSLMRKFRKILKIGLLGAWNGRRIRPWFRADYGDIEAKCRQLQIPFRVIRGLNSDEMISAVQDCHADLGVSLGNGYISPRIFNVPRLGMINLHSECLPAYQNAQCIIWPIYCHDPHSGFTIHEIDSKIDTGRILFQKVYDLTFYPTLEETVRRNKMRMEKDVPGAVAEVCAHIESYQAKARVQGHGNSYTTPSFWKFLRMCKNNRYFYAKQQSALGENGVSK